jgi:hypothetical protein
MCLSTRHHPPVTRLNAIAHGAAATATATTTIAINPSTSKSTISTTATITIISTAITVVSHGCHHHSTPLPSLPLPLPLPAPPAAITVTATTFSSYHHSPPSPLLSCHRCFTAADPISLLWDYLSVIAAATTLESQYRAVQFHHLFRSRPFPLTFKNCDGPLAC